MFVFFFCCCVVTIWLLDFSVASLNFEERGIRIRTKILLVLLSLENLSYRILDKIVVYSFLFSFIFLCKQVNRFKWWGQVKMRSRDFKAFSFSLLPWKKNCAREGNFSFFSFLFLFFLSRSKKKEKGRKVGCRCYPAIMREYLNPKVTM